MTEKTQIYLVVPVNYRYNDEYHYRSGFEAPAVAYENQKDAEDEALRRNAVELRGLQPSDYQERVVDMQKVGEILGKELGEDDWDFELPTNLTEEQAKALLEIDGFPAFFVVAPVSRGD